MTRIFVSYRREDTEGETGRIVDRLRERFGDDQVFFDTATMQGGDRWRERIDEALAKCNVLLAVIGRRWLTVTDAAGVRRLESADDVVAYEIASALARRVRLIPVLVQRAEPPRTAEVPTALCALCDYHARQIRAEAFDSDMKSLLHDIAGKWLLPSRRVLFGVGAALAAIVLPVAVYVFAPVPPAPRTMANLRLRVKLNPAINEKLLASDRMRLYQRLPVDLPAFVLDKPQMLTPGQPEFAGKIPIMPGAGERYEADLVRDPQSSALVPGSASTPPPPQTRVCFTSVPKARAAEALVRMVCEEGGRCTTAADDFGLVRADACSATERGASLSPRNLVRMAEAHAAPDPGAAEGWVVPSLDTLHRRRDGPNAPAFTEITLRSGPLPALRRATRVSYQLRVNGRNVWINGLPPNASAVAFDAASGLQLQFGLENLEFSGARRGYEQVDLLLRFLDGSTLVAESPLALPYVALRDQPEAKPAGDPALGLTWTAKYFPSSADRYQVFLLATSQPEEAERTKQRFDDAAHRAQRGDAALPLVAVIRPPMPPRNPNFGVVVGVRQPTGQIRFSFDDAASAALCRELLHLPGVRTDTYRRNIDDRQDSRRCATFAAS